MKDGVLSLWVLLLITLLAVPLGTEEPHRRRVEVRSSVGYGGFVDEGFIDLPHSVVGGSLRVYLTERFSLEPEFLYMYRTNNWQLGYYVPRGPGGETQLVLVSFRERDQDFVFNANLGYELIGTKSRVKPYLIGGWGILHHRGQFTPSGTGTAMSFGLGVKIALSERWFLSPEIRLGWEPFLRATGGIGYVLRGR